jgi:tetratricopeptide (TPR) repeat protein
MNFKLGNFQNELGEKAMAKSNAIEKSELNKIIESYFNLKYEQSIPYLAAYKEKKEDGIIHYYQLGYAYYKQNDFENAISQFNKIINGKDFVHKMLLSFRESYLKLDKKQEALNAFKMPEMAFDASIQKMRV